MLEFEVNVCSVPTLDLSGPGSQRVSHKCVGFKTKHEHKFGWKLDISHQSSGARIAGGRGSNNRVTVDLLTSVLNLTQSCLLSLLSPLSSANCVSHLTSRHVQSAEWRVETSSTLEL